MPSSYYSWQFNEKLWLGLSVNAPYGLAESFPDSWAGRAYANAYPTGTGVKANLRHCGCGGEDGRCCNKAKRDLFHDGSPLGTW